MVPLKALGESFNLMTLGGLAAAIGLVIDDAIVVVENIVMHRDSGQSPRQEAIRSALREIRVPLVGSTDLRPSSCFLPLISITGVTGTFFRALAFTVGPHRFLRRWLWRLRGLPRSATICFAGGRRHKKRSMQTS